VKDTPDLPVLSGEIPSVWPAQEVGVPEIWALSHPATYALVEGEAWSELARRLGFQGYPAGPLAEAWKRALQSMDHNYGGTGGAVSIRRKREYLIAAIITGEEARRSAMRQIAECVQLPPVPDITPLVVFNSASWSRTETATAHASFYGEVESFYRPGGIFGDRFRTVRLYDHTGQEVPFQYLEQKAPVTREATICFTALDVPAYGYRLYYLAPAETEAAGTPCCQVTGLRGARMWSWRASASAWKWSGRQGGSAFTTRQWAAPWLGGWSCARGGCRLSRL